MVKINFKTVFPHSQRDKFIHAFRDLGFSYERIIQSEEYSLFRFFGEIPEGDSETNIDIMITDDVYVDLFKEMFVGNVEIYLMFERS